MPHLKPYWKDDFVFQSGTRDELSRYKSPPRFHCKLAFVSESESSDVVAIGLDRPVFR